MYKNILAFAIIVSSISGCGMMPSRPAVKVEYRDVNLAVPVIPSPPKVKAPVYASPNLSAVEREDIGIVAKAAVLDTKLRDGYIKILELIINTYKKHAEDTGSISTLDVPGLDDAVEEMSSIK